MAPLLLLQLAGYSGENPIDQKGGNRRESVLWRVSKKKESIEGTGAGKNCRGLALACGDPKKMDTLIFV